MKKGRGNLLGKFITIKADLLGDRMNENQRKWGDKTLSKGEEYTFSKGVNRWDGSVH